MTLSNESEKLRRIYQLLFDLATGRTTLVLNDLTADDEYDQMLLTLTSLRKRLQELVVEQGIVPPYYSYEHIFPLVLVLDSGYRITACNQAVVQRLRYPEASIRHKQFEELLDISSKATWMQLCKRIATQSGYFETIALRFQTFDNKKLPLFCMVTDALLQPNVFVISVDIYVKESFYLKPIEAALTEKVKKEAALLEKVHTYILEHLDDPYLSVTSLAQVFGYDPHKLRRGFREQYQVSIYQFYHNERLKKAHLLILQTDLPLKEIAYQCGFGMYLNFYKAFKKKYGFSPSVLSRG